MLLVCRFIILSCSVWNNSARLSHTSTAAALALSHYCWAAIYWRRWKRQISWFALSAARFSCTKTMHDVWIYARAICMWKSSHAGLVATQSCRCLSGNGLAQRTSGVRVWTCPHGLGCRWNLNNGVLGCNCAGREGATGGGPAVFVGAAAVSAVSTLAAQVLVFTPCCVWNEDLKINTYGCYFACMYTCLFMCFLYICLYTYISYKHLL